MVGDGMNRSEYISDTRRTPDERRAAFREYYRQLVNDRTIRYVVMCIGADRILASTDEHLNDIALGNWDDLTHSLPLAVTFKSLGDYATLAGLVCVAKEAARQYKEAQG